MYLMIVAGPNMSTLSSGSDDNFITKTLPKALGTQALAALTSNFRLVWWVWFGRFGLVSLVG